MKKLYKIHVLLILLLCMIAICFGGCTYHSYGNDKIKVVATIFPQYDFARAVAGGNADITMLLHPGEDTHTFEPSPRDIVDIQNCDIFIYTGGESDAWIDDLLLSINTENMTVISLADIIGIEEHDHHHHDHDHEEEAYDEHVWTSPEYAVKIIEEICNAFCKRDPNNGTTYISNTVDYVKQINDLDLEITDIVKNSAHKTLIFGDRFPLLHFVKRYGLDYEAAFPGCSGSTESNPKRIAQMINYVKDNNVSIIFKVELSNGNIANTISEDTGAEVKTFYTCHSITKDDFENGETYVSLMRRNVELLKEALN